MLRDRKKARRDLPIRVSSRPFFLLDTIVHW
jgi:hypothetical protein